MLGIIVFVHEMGHYLVARWNGFAIKAFSLGFGPELIGFNDRYGTRWKLSAIPLGGYVQFLGDMNAASQPDPEVIAALPPSEQKRLFINKNVWQRIAVVIAGPAANIILTFVILYALLLGYGRWTVPPVLGDLKWGSVAVQAGLLPGDRIVSVDGFAVSGLDDFDRLVSTAPDRHVTISFERQGAPHTVSLVPRVVNDKDRFGNDFRMGDIGLAPPPLVVDYASWGGVAMRTGLLRAGDILRSVDSSVAYGAEDFAAAIAGSAGKPVTIRISRDGHDQLVTVTPQPSPVKDANGETRTVGRLGVGLAYAAGAPPTLSRPSLIEAVPMTLEEMRFIVVRTAAFIGDFFVGHGDLDQLGGPVKVARVSGEVATLGWPFLVNFMALISLNIGLVNLLPVPVLDGGHLLFYVIEAIRGRPLSQKVQEVGYRIGFAMVGALMIFSIVNDTLLRALRHLS